MHHWSGGLYNTSFLARWQSVLGGEVVQFVCRTKIKSIMAKVKETFEKYQKLLQEKLNEKNAVTDLLEKAEKATGVQRIYIAYGQ